MIAIRAIVNIAKTKGNLYARKKIEATIASPMHWPNRVHKTFEARDALTFEAISVI